MGNLFVMAEVVSSFRVLSATESLLPEFNLESMLSFVKVLLGAFGLIYFTG